MAASIGAVLLAGGSPGKRFMLSNSQAMIHQVIGGASGQASDIEIEAAHIKKLKQRLNSILAKHTGKDLKKIEKDTDRNTWLFADEAVKYGLADKVI